MKTCKDCKFFVQDEGHRGTCQKRPFVSTRQGKVQMIGGKPRTLFVWWGTNACKAFEKGGEAE